MQRIASKLGDLESFGADPRRVVYAGHDVDAVEEINYKSKYDVATGNISKRFEHFELSCNGDQNNDYVNGKGFCCTDGVHTVSDDSRTTSLDGVSPEKLLYFYHSDHLGSTSLITNFDGEVTQHVGTHLYLLCQ